MTLAVRTRLVRIGNSQGVRIPKPLLEQAGISDQVELEVQGSQIAIRPARQRRVGWREQLALMATTGDDRLLDGDQLAASTWDEEEWEW